MHPDVIALAPQTDQEEVARIASRYDLLAVPIVDDTRKFLGIVTIDDVLDVMEEEAEQDMLRMAGVDEEYDVAGVSVLRAARQRLTWLLVTTAGGIGLAEVIGGFRESLEDNTMLAAFIPVIMALGGSVALQTATITVRNLATGHLSSAGGWWLTLFRELRVGLLIGSILGAVLLGYAWLRTDQLVGLTVGVTVLGALILSAVIGALIPLALDRLRIDPALATGPFVTITIDLVAIVVYLSIATALLGL
jgi:magnesium transporter